MCSVLWWKGELLRMVSMINLVHTGSCCLRPNIRLMTISLLLPVLFDLMMALQSTETRNISLKKPGPIFPQTSQFLQYQSECNICELLLLRCKCDRYFNSIEELKTLLRHSNSLMIEENGPIFSLFHYESLLSKITAGIQWTHGHKSYDKRLWDRG